MQASPGNGSARVSGRHCAAGMEHAMGGKYRFAEEGEKMLARALREEQQEFGSFFCRACSAWT